MRKITGLCIIVALLVSIFDIIDVNDITLNGKEIFTTDNACAQHNDHDLNDSGYHAFSLNLQIFNLPQTASCTFFAEAPEHPLPCFDIPAYPQPVLADGEAETGFQCSVRGRWCRNFFRR